MIQHHLVGAHISIGYITVASNFTYKIAYDPSEAAEVVVLLLTLNETVNASSDIELNCVAHGSPSAPFIEWASVTNGRTSAVGNSTSNRVIFPPYHTYTNYYYIIYMPCSNYFHHNNYYTLVNLISHYPTQGPSWANKGIDERPFSQGGALDTAPFDLCWLKSGLAVNDLIS